MAASAKKIEAVLDSEAMKPASSNVLKRILLVDNQAHVLRVMKSSLNRNGYEVDTALSGDVALRMLRESRYDVLIADNAMVKMEGKQLVETVADQFRSRAPAMFLITDKADDQLQGWSEAIARTECVAKPLSLRYLVARLNELFGSYDDQPIIVN